MGIIDKKPEISYFRTMRQDFLVYMSKDYSVLLLDDMIVVSFLTCEYGRDSSTPGSQH